MILQKILEKFRKLFCEKILKNLRKWFAKKFSEIFKKWKIILQKIFFEISGCVNS